MSDKLPLHRLVDVHCHPNDAFDGTDPTHVVEAMAQLRIGKVRGCRLRRRDPLDPKISQGKCHSVSPLLFLLIQTDLLSSRLFN